MKKKGTNPVFLGHIFSEHYTIRENPGFLCMSNLHDEVLVNLRRIMRAADIHSRRLGKESGLTTPQLIVLRAVALSDGITVTELSREISLSQATVTSILNRMESAKLIARKRSKEDRRRVHIELTKMGRTKLSKAPQPLQEEFTRLFSQLPEWEQHLLVSSLGRIAELMHADGLDVAPLLASERATDAPA